MKDLDGILNVDPQCFLDKVLRFFYFFIFYDIYVEGISNKVAHLSFRGVGG